MKSSVEQCRYQLMIAAPMLARLDDSHLAFEPQIGLKTAGWLVGHLAVTGDFGRHLCGGVALCPREWRTAFNPGSQPSGDRTSYPSMRHLTETFQQVYDDLCVLALDASAADLRSPNPYEPARQAFPLAGDFVEYMLTGHLGYHLGQLVGWYAAAGLGRVRALNSRGDR